MEEVSGKRAAFVDEGREVTTSEKTVERGGKPRRGEKISEKKQKCGGQNQSVKKDFGKTVQKGR